MASFILLTTTQYSLLTIMLTVFMVSSFSVSASGWSTNNLVDLLRLYLVHVQVHSHRPAFPWSISLLLKVVLCKTC